MGSEENRKVTVIVVNLDSDKLNIYRDSNGPEISSLKLGGHTTEGMEADEVIKTQSKVIASKIAMVLPHETNITGPLQHETITVGNKIASQSLVKDQSVGVVIFSAERADIALLANEVRGILTRSNEAGKSGPESFVRSPIKPRNMSDVAKKDVPVMVSSAANYPTQDQLDFLTRDVAAARQSALR